MAKDGIIVEQSRRAGGGPLVDELYQLVREGKYSAAFRLFESLLKQNLSPLDSAKAHHAAAVAAFHTAQHYAARRWAEEAERLTIQAGNAELLGAVWANLVEILRVCGEPGLAVDNGHKWLNNKSLYPEEASRQGRVHLNLGWAYRSAGDLTNSLTQFENAVTVLQGELTSAPQDRRPHTERWLVRSMQMTAWTLIELHRIPEAQTWIECAYAYAHEDDQEVVREQLLLKCLAMYQLREFEAARQLCTEFLSTDQNDLTTPVQRFWCTWIMGMIYAEVGPRTSAEFFACMVMDLAIKLAEPRFMNRATELQTRLRTGRTQAG